MSGGAAPDGRAVAKRSFGGWRGGRDAVALSLSLIVFAAGAVMALAVDPQVAGEHLKTVGVIGMIVGAVGLIWSLTFAAERATAEGGDDRR